MAEYPISSRGYLRRADARLAEREYRSLFYAAFELRCGVEARIQEYMQNWKHISEKKKRGWKIAKLGKDLEQAFKTGDSTVRWEVFDRETREPLVCLYHTPVGGGLQKRAMKLGNYLHAMKEPVGSDSRWWDDLRMELVAVAKELHIANMGTLLGPPLRRQDSRRVDMNMEAPPEVDINSILDRMKEERLRIKIDYLRGLPEPVEDHAVVWRESLTISCSGRANR